MAREKGKLLSCLSKLVHHVAPHKIRLMLGAGLSVEDLEYRFALVREEAEIAQNQILKMKDVATKKGYQEILDIIEEEVEYGHDFPTS